MHSTFAIVGYGSAALHLIHAAVKLGTSVILIPRHSESYAMLRERYLIRYNQALPELVTAASPNERFIKYDVGLVATPPIAHSQSVKILLSRGKPESTPIIFVEKPMQVNIDPLPINVVSDSHLNFSDQWNNFLNKIDEISKSDSITCIESNFVEDLSAAAQSHSWEINFIRGWVTDEKKGGGPISEYSHALHWLGKILQKIGKPLPLLQVIDPGNAISNKKNNRMSIFLRGRSSNIECLVKQEMSFQQIHSRKFVNVTFKSGDIQHFDFNKMNEIETRVNSRSNLLAWLLTIDYKNSEFSLMREKATWIDLIINTYLRSIDSIIH